MSEIIVLRTHIYDGFIDQMVRALQAATRRRIVAVVDERAGRVNTPADITKLVLDPGARGLIVTHDYGWRCGDYALYEAAQVVKDATAFWMIEPDVRIHSTEIAAFFDGCDGTRSASFVTAWFVRASPQWQWYRTMEPFASEIYNTMMQLCRMSRPAALYLLRERQRLAERFRREDRSLEDWPNDEAFVAASLAKGGFRVATFREHAPRFKIEGSFGFTKPVSARWLDTIPADDHIYHPVVRGRKFRERLQTFLKEQATLAHTIGSSGVSNSLMQQQLQIEEAPEEARPVTSSAPQPLSRHHDSPASSAIADALLPLNLEPPQLGMAYGRPIPVRFWNRIRNSGDALTSILVNRLLGGKPFMAKADTPHLLGIGSTLFMANRYSTIWGSGVLNKVAYLPPIQGQQVRALRGKLSADHLLERGIRPGSIAFGDPGILADRLLPESVRSAPIKYRFAVVPHHDSITHEFFSVLRGREDVCVVDILNDSLTPLQQIAQSEIVISQSLHGLIYAESFGKPSLWISTRSDDVWNFKFNDWFTTTANPQCEPASMSLPLERLAAAAEPRQSTIDREALLQSFPDDLFQESDNLRLDFASCRLAAPAMVFLKKSYETRPGFVAARDGPVLANLSTTLSSLTNSLFAGWAERTYCVVVTIGSAAIPTPHQSQVILAAMDARSSVEFAFLIRKPTTLPPGVSSTELGAGVTLYPNYKAIGPVLYLRPSFEALKGDFIVFGT